jgi:MiaB/RimO family radical SAM methylthiotransferase
MRELKTFFVKTYGCQMNELDTEIMAGSLKKRGLLRTDDEETADLMIFNTCSIRDLAERKVMGKIGKMTKSTKNRPMIGVTGCMAMAKKETLFKKLPYIDFVIGTNNIMDLNQVLDQTLATSRPVIRTDDRFEENLDYLSAERDDKIKAYVSIIRGCDKYCTYCVVPYTRGQEVSRSPESIIEECQKLVDQGYKEITLLGQNVNSYGKNMEGSLTIFAEKGTVKIGGQYLNELEYQNIEGYEIKDLPEGNKPNNYGNYVGSMSNHDKVYQNVIDVLNNGTAITTNFFEGLKTVEIIEKIYNSAK